jgi:hypothetical protein
MADTKKPHQTPDQSRIAVLNAVILLTQYAIDRKDYDAARRAINSVKIAAD